MSNVAIIPARGGSKGLPRKNILPILEKPLIAWTIKAAQEAQSIDKVFVSTDDDEIAEISLRYGAEVIMRPEKLATDQASTEPVVGHAIEYLATKDLNVENGIFITAYIAIERCFSY